MLGLIVRQALKWAVFGAGAAAAAAGARYAGSRRINASERLGTALLDTERLVEAADLCASEPEAALAACAAYYVNLAHEAAAGISGPPALDAVGFERTVAGSDGKARATITTTAHTPEARWQFEMVHPGVARVHGSRRLSSAKFSGPRVRMRTPDTLSIHFESGYSARVESDMEFSANLLQVVGLRTHLEGVAHLSDNRGNVGMLEIKEDGEVTGTITRGSSTLGRFEGSLTEGLTFTQYPVTTS